MRRLLILLPFLVLALALTGRAQPDLSGTAKIENALGRLQVLGSALMIGAHPDDENTAVLAYLARGRRVRAAYLSLTRGEGGQNLIGSEQGSLLGVIRTQELLEARRIDGAEQFFTRAVDFGFSKSADETLAKWGREEVLSDIVWVIRRFRPDVIILRSIGEPRDGHGHHQAAGILGREAFAAAADPKRYPEQLKWVIPWQAKRLVWNSFGAVSAEAQSARLEIDAGQYDPVLGYSYAEIAGMARSMHRTQAFGSAQRRGPALNYFTQLAGERAQFDLFEGVDISWQRLPGGVQVKTILAEAAKLFDPKDPLSIIPQLLKARPLIAAMKDPWAARKLEELDEAIALCAGLWMDATADRYAATPGSQVSIRAEALNRSGTPMRLAAVSLEIQNTTGASWTEAASAVVNAELAQNQPVSNKLEWKIPQDRPYSSPYWLAEPKQGEMYVVRNPMLIGEAENPPVARVRFRLQTGGQPLELIRPVIHRYVDRARGELIRPLEIVPAVALRFSEPVVMFPSAAPRSVSVEVQSGVPQASGSVRTNAPTTWKLNPPARSFELSANGEQTTVSFTATPPAGASEGKLQAETNVAGRRIASGAEVIQYTHIRPQMVFSPAEARLVRADIKILVKQIGYVMGAGDEVPDALRQLGCEVTLLSPGDLARGNLSKYEAIVTGVRAYNVRPDLRANHQRLLEYVKQGGTLLVQYNVADSAGNDTLAQIGPHPIRVGRDRVTVEEAPVAFPNPKHPVLQSPNRVGPADFEGWVQERGLYFASSWDSQYEPLFESHDPNEPPLQGGTLFTAYGRGAYIFTSYAWFRQLPAGVPGAYRIFANLLSAGKTIQ